jgi:putative membrane protein
VSTPDDGWARLDRRTVAVTAITMAAVAAATGVPTGIGIAQGASVGTALLWTLPFAVLLVAGGALFDEVRWRRTRYRIGPERVELHTGVLVRTRRTLQRERIRSVDITADPLLRLFGLAQVKIGTGEHADSGESSIALRPVTTQAAEALRSGLLDRVATATGSSDGPLAVLDPRWIRYAPLSFLAPLLGASAFGAVLQVAEWFDAQRGVIGWVVDLFRGVPLVVTIVVLVAIALVVGTIGSLGLFVELWWRFRLEREPGGTLRVRRGLLTTRSISVEERRLRGVELVEPLGTRLVGAARVDAVATGLAQQSGNEKTDHKTLLPAAPRAVADRVVADVLREPVPPSASVRLAGHPVAARGRRLRWALATVLVLEAPLVVLGVLLTDVLLHIAWISALVLVPVAALLALDAYRNLGHGLTGGYLVARSGTVRRATVVLQRRGIIGWTAKQSVFQARAGLITLTATTAAGAGGYSILDVGESAGLTFAEHAVPDLFTPFLEERPPDRVAQPVR